MTVSQPDGDGQSSSLALLIWLMMTMMAMMTLAVLRPQHCPGLCPGPRITTIVTATSSGWQHKDRGMCQKRRERQGEEKEEEEEGGWRVGEPKRARMEVG